MTEAPGQPTDRRLTPEEFVAKFFEAEAALDSQRTLCSCGWNGEGTTVHCAFCHRTDPKITASWAHLHELRDGALVAILDPNPPPFKES